ncbi:MAG TPA: cyclic nucleotide-binding domain-containing protein [Geothermobacteraceae bacterium]|nr:cyclic nucleotide-binding domain-containing protein [Geothermobacteraceae bacterium]
MTAQSIRNFKPLQQAQSHWEQAMAYAPDCFRHLQLASGEPLWREGDPANSAGLVLSGKLSLKKQLQNSNSQLVMGVCGVNCILGEAGLLEGRMREESAVALEPSLVAMISRDDFLRLSIYHADIAQEFMLEMLGSLQDRLVGAVSRLTTIF